MLSLMLTSFIPHQVTVTNDVRIVSGSASTVDTESPGRRRLITSKVSWFVWLAILPVARQRSTVFTLKVRPHVQNVVSGGPET
jgi:hypothetical protein